MNTELVLTRKKFSSLLTLPEKVQWNQSNLSDITHQTPCSHPHRVVPKLRSHSDGGCRPSLLASIGLHSFYCHWLSKTRTKGWISSLLSLISIGTLVMWLKQFDSVSVETPPSLSPLSSSWTPPSSPFLLVPLFTAHYSVQLFGRTLRGGRCWPFILLGMSSEWWPRNKSVCFQIAQTTTENVWEEANLNLVLILSY